MPRRFSGGIGSLKGANSSIVLTCLKQTLKPKQEKILKILKEMEE